MSAQDESDALEIVPDRLTLINWLVTSHLNFEDWKRICLVSFIVVIMSNSLWLLGWFSLGLIYNVPFDTPHNDVVVDFENSTDVKEAFQQLKAVKLKYQETLEEMSRMNQTILEQVEEMSRMNQTIHTCTAELNKTAVNITQLKEKTEKNNEHIENIFTELNITRGVVYSLNMTLNETRGNVSTLKTEIEPVIKSNSESIQVISKLLASTSGVIHGLEEKAESLTESVKKTPQLMDLYGFITIEMIGPWLLLVIALEFLPMIFMYFVWKNVYRGKGAPPPKEAAAAAAAQPALINTSNNNVALLCFQDQDEAKVEGWGQDLLQDCRNLHLDGVYVVNSFQDIDSVPSCRVALVFVDPDEREMIIEDARHHIGVGLRRQTVQRLLTSGVEVFIVIFRDRKSAALPANQMYNTRLGQINEHEQLKMLKQKKRIVSINDRFAAWQRKYLLDQLNTLSS